MQGVVADRSEEVMIQQGSQMKRPYNLNHYGSAARPFCIQNPLYIKDFVGFQYWIYLIINFEIPSNLCCK